MAGGGSQRDCGRDRIVPKWADVPRRPWAWSRAQWSVGGKLALTAALVLAAAAYGLLALLDHERARLLEHHERAEAQTLQQLALGLSAPLEFDDDIAIADALAPLSRQPELVYLELTDADREGPAARMGRTDLVAPPLVGTAAARDEDTLWLAAPIVDERGKALGQVRIGLSLALLEEDWTHQRELILLACAGFGVLVLFGLVASTRAMVLLPLRRLARAAEAVGRGDSVAVAIESRDEVGRLAAAFNGMARAIHERERGLESAHAEVARLLDGMRQAIFTFGPDLRVVGRGSRACMQVFGGPIEGLDARELLLRGIPESAPEFHAIEAFLAVVFDIDPSAWDELVELAPRELRAFEGTEHERELVIEIIPLVADGRLQRVMVTATDETEARRVQREIGTLRDRHAAEIAAMRRLLAVGVQVFVEFEMRSRARLDRVESMVSTCSDAEVFELMRLVHAVRGGARSLGLLELEAALSEAEGVLGPVRDAVRAATLIPAGWRPALTRALEAAREGLLRARERMVAASPLGEQVFDQVTVSARDLDRLAGLRDEASAAVRGCIDRLCARPFAEVVTGLSDALEFWAASEGKRAQLVVEGADVRVDREETHGLRSAVTQIVRNAIAHGIELPEQRAAAGKPAIGLVRVRCEADADGTSIEVRDDGGGIAFDVLRPRAGRRGLGLADEELIFVDGLSSRTDADALAGQGVGMGAVADELAALGYRVALAHTGPDGTCFRIRRRTSAGALRITAS